MNRIRIDPPRSGFRPLEILMPRSCQPSAAFLVLVLLIPSAFAQSERIEPGWNLFSKDQDISLGKEAAVEIEKEVQVVDDRALTNYIDGIGKRLAAVSQDPSYDFTFKVVADPNINAFALPGGPIYVNSGLITAADNEAQVAGVVAHEIGHVVLRHSTNQASKRSIFQLPAALAAGAIGNSGGLLGSLGNIGLGFGLNSVFMKYSRSAEHDADIVGARMMAAAGYNPVEMATFFQKLEEAGGGGGPQFLSDHPNPGNRVQYVTEEIQSYSRGSYTTNTTAFSGMKARAASIQPVEQTTAANGADVSTVAAAPQAAAPAQSGRLPRTSANGYEFVTPTDWQVTRSDDNRTMTVVPEDGVRSSRGTTEIRRGILSGYFELSGTLAENTQRFLANLRETNSRLRAVQGQQKQFELAGTTAESNLLEGPSRTVRGENVNVWVVTAQRPEGLFYLTMISPVREYDSLYPNFERAVTTVGFTEPQSGVATPTAAPEAPTTGSNQGVYLGNGFSLRYPANWTATGDPQSGGVRITPANGVLPQPDGSEPIVRGLLAGTFATSAPLQTATTDLLTGFQSSNPDLTMLRGQRKSVTVDGRPGESLFLSGTSKIDGQGEYVWLVTAQETGGLFYLVMIAPESEYNDLYPLFEAAVNSVDLD